MSDTITVTGLVATTPRHVVTTEGLAITSFRLASTQRRFDRSQEKWVDGETNWYTVTAFRQLATNVTASVKKGERVIVAGRLRIRDWENGERAGTNIDVEADALGHDLTWGTATFSRSIAAARVEQSEFPAEAAGAAEATDAAGASGTTGDGDVRAAEAPGAEDNRDAQADLVTASGGGAVPF